MARTFQMKRATAARWTEVNPILAEGEPGYDTTAGVFRIGDGVSTWSDLAPTPAATSFTTIDVLAGTDPGAAAAGHMTIYGKAVAGRIMLKAVGPSGLDYAAQPWLARNKIGIWQPPGNATTVPGVFGYTAPSTVGTVVARNVATTNLFTRMRRIGYYTAATAGALVSYRISVAQVTTGTGTQGGFHKVIRFGVSDNVLTTGARMFMGMSTSTSAPTNVEPSTLKNCIGVGHGAADTNLMLFSAGSVSQPPIDLGTDFPLSTNTDPYELSLFSPPSGAGEIDWEVTNLNSGITASGSIDPAGGVVLPGSTTLLCYAWGYRTNNATATMVAWDIMGDYIESDN